MKVTLLADSKDACYHYRIAEPARALRDQRPDLEITVADSDTDWRYTLGAGLSISLDGQPKIAHIADPQTDVVVLQRPSHRHHVEAIPFLQAYGTAVVVELDDALDCLDVDHPLFDAVQPHQSPDRNWRWLREAMRLADLVTVTTEALAESVGHDRVRVIPNYVPAWYLDVGRAKLDRSSHADEVPVIGWYGSPATHPGDLDVAAPAVREFVRSGAARFHGIGDQFIPYAMGVEGTTSPWSTIRELPHLIAAFDIGIAPLKLSAFNQHKSWLKPLEMAACGVPFVASPTEPYRALRDGYHIGRTAHSDEDWRERLGALVDSAAFRRKNAIRNWRGACALTVEEHADEWVTAWYAAHQHRRKAAA